MEQLRQTAQDLAIADRWEELLDLAPKLRNDVERWVDLWAPSLAIAARRLGDLSGRGFLDEAVARGFWQPELFGGQLEELFGTDPDWTDVVAAMAANVPAPTIELTSWPGLSPAHPLRLNEIAPDQVELLRARVPQPLASAWATATNLLRWVSCYWQHSGDFHVDVEDAVHVLEQVDSGARFACVEYTIVLSQALNACGIPARSVVLLLENHHAGIGRAHQVTEAWIDDLDKWVVLDGQNGMYWTTDDKEPLSLTELRRLCIAGEPLARLESLAGKRSAEEPAMWWGHFHSVRAGGYMVPASGFSPVFQDQYVPRIDQLCSDPAGLHPDLLEVGVGIADVSGKPAIRPLTRHPHARGFEVAFAGSVSRLGLGDSWVLPKAAAGSHTATIATVTDYGAHRPHPLHFATRQPPPRS